LPAAHDGPWQRVPASARACTQPCSGGLVTARHLAHGAANRPPRPRAPSTAHLFFCETIIEAKSPFAFSSLPSRSSFSITLPLLLPCPPSVAIRRCLSGTANTLVCRLLLEQAWLKTGPKPPAAFNYVRRQVPPHGRAASAIPWTNHHHRELPTVAPQLLDRRYDTDNFWFASSPPTPFYKPPAVVAMRLR
jgi:hypothetical protein